jgi:predicted MFS family arabinose efflux permease
LLLESGAGFRPAPSGKSGEMQGQETIGTANRWYVVGLGAVINLFVFAMATSCMPVLFSEIADKLGLSVVQVGTVWGASSLAGIFSIPLAGFLADRYSSRRILAIWCLLAGVFGAMRGLSNSFYSLAATSLLFGFASEAIPVIVVKNASLWFYGRGLGTAQGLINACVGGGMMLGAAFSATLLSPWLGGWQHVMFFYGAVSALMGAVWFLTTPEPRTPQGAPQRLPRAALAHVLHNRGVWLIAIAMMGFAGCNKGVMGYLPLYLQKAGWTPASADGALASLNAAGTAGAIPLALLSDWFGTRKSIILPGLAVTAVAVGLLAVLTGPAAWLLAALSGLFRDAVWAVVATLTVENEGIGPVYAGTAVGIVQSFTRLGYTFAPPAGNSLVAAGPGLPFVFWAGLTVMALVVFAFVRERGTSKQQVVSVK